MLFTFTLSINISMSINVAQKCVSYSKEKLVEFIKVCYLVNKAGILFLIFMLYIFRDEVLSGLTTGPEMKIIAEDTIPIIYFYLFFDNGYFFLGGVLKGLAYLVLPAVITIMNFYVIQISLSYFFCLYLGLGVKGIWMSLAIGTCFSYSIFFYLFKNLDIDKMKQEANDRINFDKKGSIGSDKNMPMLKGNNYEMDDFNYGINNKTRRISKLYNDEF